MSEEYCNKCGNPKLYPEKPCLNCQNDLNLSNSSGQKYIFTVPENIKGWNWGAFVCPIPWGLFNKSYWTVLTIVPYIGIIWCVVCALKGNEWAWKNKKWESIEQFHKVQKNWAIGSLIFFILGSMFYYLIY